MLVTGAFLLGTLAARDVEAQERVTFHIKVGEAFTNLRGPDPRVFATPFGGGGENPDALEFDGQWNVTGGVAIEIPVTGMFSIQPEVLYSRRSSNVKLAQETITLDPDAQLRIRAEYLEIPILAKFYTGHSPNIRLYFYGGLTFAFRLSAESETQFLGAVETDDIKDQLKSTDLGYILGFGLDLGAHLSAEFRQHYGTKDIIAVEFDEKITWGAAIFTLGVRF